MGKQKIQGGDSFTSTILKCYCGEMSYLEIIHDDEDGQTFFEITLHPTKLKERLRLAWKSLRGLEFFASNEVIIDDSDLPKVIEALSAKVPPKKESN